MIIKEKNAALLCLAFVFVLLIFVLILKDYYPKGLAAAILGDGSPVEVIIDAGHGLPDGGAVAPDKTYESGINLQFAKAIQAELEQRGIAVVMTRSDENGIYDSDKTTIRSQKVSDIKNRLEIMSKYKDAVFISIHQNTYTSSKYSGTHVFYAKTDGSRELASLIQKGIREKLQPENKRVEKLAENTVYLMKNAPGRAILIECGFITNAKELARLKDESYQKEFASVVGQVIAEYVKKDG